MIHFVFKTFYNYAQAFISAKKYVAKQIFGWIYPETNLLKGNSPTLTPNATAVGKKIHNPLTKAQWKWSQFERETPTFKIRPVA